MGYDFLYEVNNGIATLTLNRPEVMNALTFEIYAQLRDLFEALRFDEVSHTHRVPLSCMLECVCVCSTGYSRRLWDQYACSSWTCCLTGTATSLKRHQRML